MNYDARNKVEFIVIVIGEFAKKKQLTDAQAFPYLQRFNGISFLNKHYDIAHTLDIREVVDDITAYCRRHGGAIA